MEEKVVLSIKVKDVGDDKFLTEFCIPCSPVTLIGALTEVIIKINETVNNFGILPKNGIWTVVCEEVGERLLEESKKM